jgi:hypothetical protein
MLEYLKSADLVYDDCNKVYSCIKFMIYVHNPGRLKYSHPPLLYYIHRHAHRVSYNLL